MTDAKSTELLEQLEARYQEAVESGATWRLSADELLAAYAVGRRNFKYCDLTGANLYGATLTGANLDGATLTRATLYGANLTRATLTGATLYGATLTRATLDGATLDGATLTGATLTGATLDGATLDGANLSNVKGWFDALKYLEENFEFTAEGMIAYKTFDSQYRPNPEWVIEPGSVISEVVNPCPGTDCGCGVNVAPLAWVKKYAQGEIRPVWKVLIRNAWLPGVIVPFKTDGKIRATRVELIEIVS